MPSRSTVRSLNSTELATYAFPLTRVRSTCQLRRDPVVQRDALGGGFEGEAAVEVFAHPHVQTAAVGARYSRGSTAGNFPRWNRAAEDSISCLLILPLTACRDLRNDLLSLRSVSAIAFSDGGPENIGRSLRDGPYRFERAIIDQFRRRGGG